MVPSYKCEHIEQDLEDGTITTYTQGNFTDLCRGPHLMNTVYLDANKLNERNQPKPNSFDETIIRNGKQSVESVSYTHLMEKFCKIWEACSDMSFHIQQKLPNMTEIFGKDISNFKLERFDDFPIAPQQSDNSFGMKTIEKLLEIPVKKEKEVSEIDYNDSFQPCLLYTSYVICKIRWQFLSSQFL